MTTTLPNRIAGHFDTPDPIALPDAPPARKAAYEDAILAAVLFYARRLQDRDGATAERAAAALLALESTRLRHGRKIAGTHDDDFDAKLKPLTPIDSDRFPHDDEDADDSIGDDLANEEEDFEDDFDDDEEFDDEEFDDDEDVPTSTGRDVFRPTPSRFSPDEQYEIESAFAKYTAERDRHERRLRDEAAAAESAGIAIVHEPARPVPFPNWGADRWPDAVQ